MSWESMLRLSNYEALALSINISRERNKIMTKKSLKVVRKRAPWIP